MSLAASAIRLPGDRGECLRPAVAQTLDLSLPVALMLVAVLHFLVDADEPARVVATLLGALAAITA